ncbi:MAG: Imm63 family immunity protein [Cyclobacteriaceae bacterium]
MTTLNPDDLRKRLETELKKIDGDIGLLPEINNSNDFAKPFIEIDRYGYNYVCRERGEEIFRKIPFDLDELFYEVFDNLTFEMATKWEVKNRKENEDFRQQMFAKQVDLMTRINKDFGVRLNSKLQRILKFEPLTK